MQKREQMTPPFQGRLARFSDILSQHMYFSISNGPNCRLGAYMWVVTELPSFHQGGCGEAAQDRGGLWRALCKAEALKNALPIHHPQREVLGCAPPREGRAWQSDPQQLPGKNNPGVTWINKKHFASLNITWLSSCSLTLEFPSKHSVFPLASVCGFHHFLCFLFPLLFFFFLWKAAPPILLFSLSCSVFMYSPHIPYHLVHFQFFFTGCSLRLSPFKPYTATCTLFACLSPPLLNFLLISLSLFQICFKTGPTFLHNPLWRPPSPFISFSSKQMFPFIIFLDFNKEKPLTPNPWLILKLQRRHYPFREVLPQALQEPS